MKAYDEAQTIKYITWTCSNWSEAEGGTPRTPQGTQLEKHQKRCQRGRGVSKFLKDMNPNCYVARLWWIHTLHVWKNRIEQKYARTQTRTCKTGDIRKMSALYRCQKSGCDIMLHLCKMTQLGKTECRVHRISLLFLPTAWDFTIILG